ncbi:MAG: YlbF family regulator [Ruminococcaceae bacterium]|nr:YlbF family regulator [Oscillospiraceae bacterium]
MGIFELAAELGKTLKNDKRLIALEEARKAYENDERVGKLMTEYEVQQKAIQNEVAKAAAERNDELLKMIQARIDAIYDQIVATETYKALEKAQNDVNELMELVNSTITFNITGEQPSSCTHDCSSCGGCH